MQMCVNTLNMAPFTLTSLYGEREHLDSNNFHISLCMRCCSRSTIIEYFSCVWRHMIQKRCYVISTMDHPEDTSYETLHHIRLCGTSFTSLHYSNMLMLMPASIQSVKDVPAEIRSQQPHYSLM